MSATENETTAALAPDTRSPTLEWTALGGAALVLLTAALFGVDMLEVIPAALETPHHVGRGDGVSALFDPSSDSLPRGLTRGQT